MQCRGAEVSARCSSGLLRRAVLRRRDSANLDWVCSILQGRDIDTGRQKQPRESDAIAKRMLQVVPDNLI